MSNFGILRFFHTQDIPYFLISLVFPEHAFTAHISPINDICIMDGQKGNVGAFMTSGGDGLVFMWNWQNLRNQLEN